MSQTIAALVFLSIGMSASLAQGKLATPTATSEELTSWLHGSDERLIAWGAAFAAQNRDENAVPQLELLTEAWQPLPRQEYDESGNYVPRTPSQVERTNAMAQVLDALIRLHGTITAQAVEQISTDFPAQALTVFARMPEPLRTEFTTRVYRTRRDLGTTFDWREAAHDQMVHLAAAILAQHPPAGFTASLLNEATVVLNVSVTDKTKEPDGVFQAGPCGDSLATKPDPGWPQPWTYVVEENWPQQITTEMSVLVAGEPAITTRRAESNSSCSTLDWFSSAVRLRLAEQEAGPPIGAFHRPGDLQYDDLAYPGPEGYRKAMLALVARHAERFQQLATDLERKGLLDKGEANVAIPTFMIRVVNECASGAVPLPRLSSTTPKIVFEGSENAAQDAFSNQFRLSTNPF